MEQILYFTMGLTTPTRMLLDASVGGTIKIKTTYEIRELIENQTQNDYNPHSSEETPQKSKQDEFLKENLLARNRLFRKQFEILTKKLKGT